MGIVSTAILLYRRCQRDIIDYSPREFDTPQNPAAKPPATLPSSTDNGSAVVE